ncbi:MAG: hypothetical protein KDD35_09130 [Bdellovibrionales bacterium]|nr:hypothetical protein [Bdellovibrionales bacterium]
MASLSPFGAQPTDVEVDRELALRRLQLEKKLAAASHLASGLDKKSSENPADSDTREGLKRFMEFIKNQQRENPGNNTSKKRRVADLSKEKAPESVFQTGMRQYSKVKNAQENFSLKGLQLDKMV